MNTPPLPAATAPRAWYRHLYVQVLLAVAVGVLIGWWQPETGKSLKPLGDGFINLVKMIIAPIIFCTIVHGLASMTDLKKLGRVGGKTILYFEVVSTFALVLGLVIVNWLQPGVGFQGGNELGAGQKVAQEAIAKAHNQTTASFLLEIIPKTFVGAFADGNLLQVLLIAGFTAFAVSAMGEKGAPVLRAVDTAAEVFFGIMRLVVKLAPIGAFGAMASTVGSHGIKALGNLGLLMVGFYLTAIVFIVVVLGSIARFAGFNIFLFLRWIRTELLLVLGTSSSETALPGMLRRLRALGCSESTTGLVIPIGYSFNLDGTNIYMTMAAIFLAQATNTPLDLRHQITLLLVAMVSSKGASGITGAGFVTLAATLSAVPGIPIESLGMLVGIDRFMSECRALTNLVGNGVATVVISRWEGEVTAEELQARLASGVEVPADKLQS